MAYQFTIEPDMVRLTLSGVLTEQDLVGAAEAIERDRDPIPHRITDMTGVTDLQIAYPDVRSLAERRRTQVFPNAFKSAIVVRTPAQKGVARMFQTLNDNPKITIRIFEDEAAVLEWIRGQADKLKAAPGKPEIG